MSDLSVAIHHLLSFGQGLLNSSSMQQADKDTLQAHLDSAKLIVSTGVAAAGVAVAPAVETLGETAGSALLTVEEAAVPLATKTVDELITTATASIPVVGGMISGELVSIANNLLAAADGKIEHAIGALFHVKGFETSAPMIQTVTSVSPAAPVVAATPDAASLTSPT